MSSILIDPAAKATASPTNLTAPHSIVYHDGYIYVGCRDATYPRIYKIDATNYSSSSYITLDGAVSAMARVGDYLWASCNDGKVYKIAISTFSEDTSYIIVTVGGTVAQGLCSDGEYVYTSWYANGWIAKIKIDDGTITTNQLLEPTRRLRSLVEDGDYLYGHDNTNYRFCKINKSDLTLDTVATTDTGVCTNDMAQNDTYIYLGRETVTKALYRAAKSNLVVTSVSPIGIGFCYGVFRVVDSILYLDFENDTIWEFDSDLGLLDEVVLTGLGSLAQINEAVDDRLHNLHLTTWNPAGVVRLEHEATYPIDVPTIESSAATSIGHSSARLNYDLVSRGGLDTTVHAYWGKTDGLGNPVNWDSTANLGVKTVGTGHYDISSLDPETKYYFRFRAVNTEGEDWTITREFTTLAEPPSSEVPVTNGLVLHLDATQGITKDANDKVSAWADQSGEGNHATQATSANQPLWVDAVVAGKAIIRFGGSHYLSRVLAATISTAGFTTFVVSKPASATLDVRTLSFSNANFTGNDWTYWLLCYRYDLNPKVMRASRGNGSDFDLLNYAISDAAEWNIAMAIQSATGSAIYYNGVQGDTSGVKTVDVGAFRVGRRADSTTNYMNGDIAEILTYDRALTTQEREDVEQYLGEKWLGWINHRRSAFFQMM